jgi:DDE family transposase
MRSEKSGAPSAASAAALISERRRSSSNGNELSILSGVVEITVYQSVEKMPDIKPEEWLLIEWPEDEKAPTKYWFSTVPANIAFRQLVDIAKLRWRIERDYHELKPEVGLGHFEGRGWRGLHHHATLCIAAYAFLVSERETIPPSGTRSIGLFKEVKLPEAPRPRGSARP